MKFCNFCAKTCMQVKNINENNVTCGSSFLNIKELLSIFQDEINKYILEEKDALICSNCLKKLRKCYEFVQQIKESENKLIRGKEIKIEHDYFEKSQEESVTDNTKEKVNEAILGKQTCPEAINTTSLKFRPILPKTSMENVSYKKVEQTSNIKSRLYKCLHCTEFFKSYKHLNEHEKSFCKNKSVKLMKVCKFCHKSYSKENLLTEHVNLKHADGEFLCCLCEDKIFSAKGYLSRHIEKVHDIKSLQYFCGECSDMPNFSAQDEMRSHFIQKHPADNGKTDDEQTQTALDDEDMDLEMHEEFLDEFLLAHTNENSFQFSECWEALDLHLPDMLQESAANIHNLQGFTQAFSCPKCYEQFKSPQPLLKHLADIHNLPVLVCRACGKCIASFKDFKRHKLQQCPKRSTYPITLECPYCSKKFKSSLSLKQHLRIVHCQLKKHICQLCDKLFSTLDHLKKHVLSQHQNERKHVCTICDKKFTQLGHLKQHLAIHTTGKQIECLECSSKFWRKIDLETHCQKNHISSTQHT